MGPRPTGPTRQRSTLLLVPGPALTKVGGPDAAAVNAARATDVVRAWTAVRAGVLEGENRLQQLEQTSHFVQDPAVVVQQPPGAPQAGCCVDRRNLTSLHRREHHKAADPLGLCGLRQQSKDCWMRQ